MQRIIVTICCNKTILKHFGLKSIYINVQTYKVVKVSQRRKTKNKLKIALCFLLVFVILALVYYFAVICPAVVALSQEKVRAIATKTISEVVGQVLTEGGYTYDELVEVTYSSENKVSQIATNSTQVNLLVREVTALVQERFDELDNTAISVNLGSFSGIPFLFGYGPQIQLNLVPVGTVQTSFDTKFLSAGINQTLHSLYFDVNAVLGLLLPGSTQNFQTNLQILICESVIVGEIPSIYLQGQIA